MTTASLTTYDGLDLHVTVHGPDDAPVSVLLAHCWTADESDWHYQVEDLLSRFGHQVRVITWDHRGHGRSSRTPEKDCTIPNLARDLGAVADTFAPDGLLVIAGHSIGGMTITEIPDECPHLLPRIAGLALISTSGGDLHTVTLGLPEVGPMLRDRLPFLLATRARMLSLSRRQRFPMIERTLTRKFLFGQPQKPRDIGHVVDQLIHCPPETWSGFFRDMMAHDRIGSLTRFDGIPTIVLVGSHDVVTPPNHARVLSAGIRGARLVVAPEAGHYLPFERRELVSDELGTLTEGALARAAGSRRAAG
ncbi:alpha/beta hydrolase [Nocardioides humilatus]|uniref:Alpha/beta hydrolase n=1 Tax=Nocardioides humilatus TaxID=2607660 RepID=A0A5B1LL25_9ACTN|nr:alpha/beta hydrolase [Nocardioides humilatus]KAA1421412.1 alpha/beta hydrolase [Nocardioides humilatus]